MRSRILSYVMKYGILYVINGSGSMRYRILDYSVRYGILNYSPTHGILSNSHERHGNLANNTMYGNLLRHLAASHIKR